MPVLLRHIDWLEGKTDEANQIRAELGLGQGQRNGDGQGRGYGKQINTSEAPSTFEGVWVWVEGGVSENFGRFEVVKKMCKT